MRRTLAIVIVLVAGQAWGGSVYYTGNDLLGFCETDDSDAQGICLGYLAGISDSIDYYKGLFPEAGRGYFFSDTCQPQNASVGQIEKVWIKWANEHPEKLHLSGFSLVILAFADAWPCP